MAEFDKIIIITKKTALEEMVERFGTREQARFYLEHMGASFDGYQQAHEAYVRSLAALKAALPEGVRTQFVERAFVPNFLFGDRDLVVTLGPDGLVINVAKYLTHQPLLAFNPDPQRIDGVLIPFRVEHASQVFHRALAGDYPLKKVTMAKASLNDGQVLYGVNDLFLGQRTHVSARYRLRFRGQEENHSSSGIIVSTGAGSTGWFRSVITGAAGMMAALTASAEVAEATKRYRFDWEADYLYFSVREPFVSKVSSAELVFGRIEAGEELEVISQMPQNGVIFSDGIESDFLRFDSGAIARIGLAEKKVHLFVGK
jgi:NAD kinase